LISFRHDFIELFSARCFVDRFANAKFSSEQMRATDTTTTSLWR
jgi:hypothetical protein